MVANFPVVWLYEVKIYHFLNVIDCILGKQTGLEVTQVFPESGLMGLNFPQYLSDYTTNRVKQGIFFFIFFYYLTDLYNYSFSYFYYVIFSYEFTFIIYSKN